MADASETDDLEHEIPAGDIAAQDGLDPPPEAPLGDESDEDEVLISFEGEEGSPPSGEAQDSSVIRRLREENRKKDAQLKALQAKVPQPKPVEIGPKPALVDFDYDEERYDEALLEWNADVAAVKKAEADAITAQQAHQQAWNDDLAKVNAAMAKIGAKDIGQARETVIADLPEMQQAMIVRAASDPESAARLIYALGKNAAKRAEFAKIEDPVKAIAWLVRTEGKLTVTRQRPPSPEQIARGSAPLSAGADKHLERLEKEAERSGDRTAVIAYRRQLRAKAK